MVFPSGDQSAYRQAQGNEQLCTGREPRRESKTLTILSNPATANIDGDVGLASNAEMSLDWLRHSYIGIVEAELLVVVLLVAGLRGGFAGEGSLADLTGDETSLKVDVS